MTTLHDDRRHWPRYSAVVPCQIDGISQRTSVRLTELSIGGRFVDANARLHAGGDHHLVIDLDGTELGLPACVVYGLCHGIRFACDMDDMPPKTREQIEQFLKRKRSGVEATV